MAVSWSFMFIGSLNTVTGADHHHTAKTTAMAHGIFDTMSYAKTDTPSQAERETKSGGRATSCEQLQYSRNILMWSRPVRQCSKGCGAAAFDVLTICDHVTRAGHRAGAICK